MGDSYLLRLREDKMEMMIDELERRLPAGCCKLNVTCRLQVVKRAGHRRPGLKLLIEGGGLEEWFSGRLHKDHEQV